MEYNPRDIERKWRSYWKDKDIYKVEIDKEKPKFYVLDMFPYPSGSGLHVGHPLGYIASDIYSRYKRLNGFNVLHPMGYDAFGLPAEQYAITTGVHPAVSTAENINRYREQLDNLGFSFDWSREVQTSDPKYYRWTQWIFLQLFDHYFDTSTQKARSIEGLVKHFEASGNQGLNVATTQENSFTAEDWNGYSRVKKDEVLMNYRLAYRKVNYVNWCEELGTVLANDEVKDGLSERGGYPVERKPMLQWSLRITAYAERLLNDLDTVEWSEALKTMQRNWIGRSEGAQVFFELDGAEGHIEVFTTRPDTIFGATFMVLAPEHPLVEQLTTSEQKGAIDAYLKYVGSRSERERMAETKEVTGEFTGAFAINPFTKEKVPIWIAEYVLMDYGTGSIMAVPSDDDRDHAFATKFGLSIIDVIDKSDYPGAGRHDKLGKMINSGMLNGMEVPDAIEKILQEIQTRDLGSRRINYKLRDANYSRQRYWGEPFPIIYDKEGVTHRLADQDLPLELPPLENFKPASGGKSPLARLDDWVNLSDGRIRETDTMPGFAGSSWYFLRYMDARNEERFVSKEAIDYWKEVDLYVGGTEHAVGHLMYSRFWHKFLHDLGLVPTVEPFKKLINQGMIQGVIEFIYLRKDEEGTNRFYCTDVAKAQGVSDVTKIPLHIDFVKEYGTAGSYLDLDGIKKFIDWRPEYADAFFVCGKGTYHKGVFSEDVPEDQIGLATHSEVGKMSKSKYNVINPDDVVEQYGADCFRMYEMFLGPIEQSKPWDTKGIDGVSKFLRKLWSCYFSETGEWLVTDEESTKEELKVLHTLIKKIQDDVERFSFNTCVSGFMIAINDLKKLDSHKRAILEPLAILMAPFGPHIAEELWG
ncbi:MAG: leucine--tRNA ligase, partial [Saprospiraceae bacterium]|nr:leucine--tRNA ligase [Saprospiraceae bacterium]